MAEQRRRIASAEQIRAAVGALADAIARDHPPGETLLIVAVLKGAVIFLADLIRRLPMPLGIEFVRARSYSGTQQREIEILDDVCELGLTGRRVLLLDCVLDSGRTLAALQREVARCRPASLKTCVLLGKQRERAAAVEVDYVGLEIPDAFVVGYGLDCDGRWRHLPYLAAIEQQTSDATGGTQ